MFVKFQKSISNLLKSKNHLSQLYIFQRQWDKNNLLRRKRVTGSVFFLPRQKEPFSVIPQETYSYILPYFIRTVIFF